MNIENHIKDVTNALNEYTKEIKRLNDSNKGLYTAEEVRELLNTQRGNCYVAVLRESGYNKRVALAASTAPEPGGDEHSNCHWNRRNL